jgi:DNA-directed RNA polymerase specialized sigma24 family protein
MRAKGKVTLDELEGVYRRDRASFERIAAAIVGDEQLGCDAVHDAFVQALRHRDRFRQRTPVEASVWRFVIGEARKRRAHIERSARLRTGPGVARRDAHRFAAGFASRARPVTEMALTSATTSMLDQLIAPDPQPTRWESVIDSLDTANRRRWRWLVRALVVLGVAIVTAALALAWPFGGGAHKTLVERAAADIGEGPVLHFVVRSDWGGALIDLKTGRRTFQHATEELWYEPQHGIHEISRFAGVAQNDAIYPPGRLSDFDPTLAGLVTRYRQALREGSAIVLGRDSVEGQPVYWIRVSTELLPDRASRLHTWADDVAVSEGTFEPVAVRRMRDGNPQSEGRAIVLRAESVSESRGDFTRMKGDSTAEPMKTVRGRSLTPSEASSVLGRPALWAGPSVGGLDLVRIWKDERSQGYDAKSKRWAETYTGATFSYGANPPAAPFLQIHESRSLDAGFQRVVVNYSPPEGSLLVFDAGIAVMQKDGLYLALEASSEGLLLAAARALERLPQSEP